MLIKVSDGVFFPVHYGRNMKTPKMTRVPQKIISRERAMTQVISLIESEDGFFLEATGRVLNQKNTDHPATLTKLVDLVVTAEG